MTAVTVSSLPVAGSRPDTSLSRRAETAAWAHRHLQLLLSVDILAITLAAGLALGLRFGFGAEASVGGVPYATVTFLAIPVWIATLALNRCYDSRLQDSGELRRVVMASFRLAGIVAIGSYVGKLDFGRGYLAIALPTGMLLLLAGRVGVRAYVVNRRQVAGEFTRQVLVMGDPRQAQDFVRMLGRDKAAAYRVAGVCLPGSDLPDVAGVPVVGTLGTAVEAAKNLGVDTIAVTASSSISSDALRRLSWELEGSGIDMVVAPALTDVAGPRIHVTPVAGLPLLQITEPELGVVHRTVKAVFDKTVASLVMLLVAPVMLALAFGVWVTSPGPAFFRQERVGRDGRTFRVGKP